MCLVRGQCRKKTQMIQYGPNLGTPGYESYTSALSHAAQPPLLRVIKSRDSDKELNMPVISRTKSTDMEKAKSLKCKHFELFRTGRQ